LSEKLDTKRKSTENQLLFSRFPIGLFYPSAEQISCIVVPFDGPKSVFRQAHSFFENCIVTADADLDFLFHQILAIQRVIE